MVNSHWTLALGGAWGASAGLAGRYGSLVLGTSDGMWICRFRTRKVMEYRFYWIGPDEHIQAARNLECASDAEARAKALEIIGDFPTMEVWEGTRRVERLTGRASDQRNPRAA